MRFVLDTNVLVSAVIARGVSRQLFNAWRNNRVFDLIVCPMLLGELSGVLRRERFRAIVTQDEVRWPGGRARTCWSLGIIT